jgi:hypothetical protein
LIGSAHVFALGLAEGDAFAEGEVSALGHVANVHQNETESTTDR